MTKISTLLLTVLCSSLLISCVQVVEPPNNSAQLAISSVRDLPITYPQGSSFALSPKYVEHVSLKPEQQKKVYQIYKAALIKNLQADGYKLASNEKSANFLVGFAVALGQDLDDKTINEKFGVMPGLPTKGEQEKGSLLVYIEDARSAKRVWRSTVQGFVHTDLSPEERDARTDYVIKMALNNFHSSK